MSNRNKGIIAYGTDADRDKLAVLSMLSGKSGSEFIIDMIRERYNLVVGDGDPKHIIGHHT